MIEKVRIVNFRSMQDMTVDLSPFTVIVGDNDSGKSSFLAAISGGLYNLSEKGDIRNGSVNSSVLYKLEGGVSVRWTRGSKNSYLLQRKDGSKEDFIKIGRGAPPQEIQKVFNVMEESFGSESFKFQYQEQFEGPLVSSCRSTLLATLFDRLIGVGILSKASGFCREDISSLQSKISLSTVRLNQLREDKKEKESLLSELKEVQLLCFELDKTKILIDFLRLKIKLSVSTTNLRIVRVMIADLKFSFLNIQQQISALFLSYEEAVLKENLLFLTTNLKRVKYELELVKKFSSQLSFSLEVVSLAVLKRKLGELGKIRTCLSLVSGSREFYFSQCLLVELLQLRFAVANCFCLFEKSRVELQQAKASKREWLSGLKVCSFCTAPLTGARKERFLKSLEAM